jgi:UDP-2,3-diacylglucosamine hydrolase
MRPLWVLADPHGGAGHEADRALVELFDAAEAERVDLLLLGDLFFAWIAIERFWSPFQRDVLTRIARLRGRGQRITFIAGNRDYLARDLEGSIFDAVHDEEAILDLGGRRTLVAHGDRLDTDDHLYRAWRRVSRSTPATAILRALPGAVGRRLATRTEHALKDTNRRYKTGDLPLHAIERFGRKARELGAERALVGHFHHDRVVDVAGGVPVIIAPGWLDHQRILALDPDGALRSTPPIVR